MPFGYLHKRNKIDNNHTDPQVRVSDSHTIRKGYSDE